MSQLLLSTLGVVCPACDEYNPPKAAKCASCGSPLLVDKRPASGGFARPQVPPPHPSPAPPPAVAQPKAQAPARPIQPLSPGPFPGAGPLPQRAPSPPGMRPSGIRPALEPAPGPPGVPIPATELLKKPAAPAARFGLAVMAGSNKGQRFRLAGATCQVGRSRGAIVISDDPFLSPLHATFFVRDGALWIRDEGSASGVFVAIPGQEPIAPNALFSAGNRVFRFTGALVSPKPSPGSPMVYGAPMPSGHTVYGVEEMLVGGRAGRAVITGGPLLTIGQSLCDLSFPKEEGMATRHCELSPTPAGAALRDLSGGLGTFVRISGERALNFGDRIRIGQEVLQVES